MTDEMSPPPLPDDHGEVPDRGAGGARLMSELRQAQARADRAERELERTRRSASYVVGNMLVRAAKDPRRLLTLPRDLWRVWRLRKSRRTAAGPTAAPIRTREVLDLDAARLLIPRLAAVSPGRGLSIAGAIGSATARNWSPYAAVSSALPHEAAALIEAIDPDVVVIDTSASLPGESWSHLGDPTATDRLMAAAALVDAAHALGRPAVLLRMTPPAHTAFLDGLAERCDLVVDGPGAARRAPWHPGVDPLATVRSPAAPALLDLAGWESVASRAPRAIAVDPALPPDAGWARALADSTGVLAPPVPSGLLGASLASVSALVAGRRVLAAGDNDLACLLEVRPDARTAAVTTRDPVRLADLVADGPLPLSADEQRAALAAILLAAAAPVQLTTLVQRLGIESRPRACWDVALVADPDVDVDLVLAQAWQPRELIVSAGSLPDRARETLDHAGIAVIEVATGARPDLALIGASSPYAIEQADLRDAYDVLDLLAGHLLGQPARSHPTDARLVDTRLVDARLVDAR